MGMHLLRLQTVLIHLREQRSEERAIGAVELGGEAVIPGGLVQRHLIDRVQHVLTRQDRGCVDLLLCIARQRSHVLKQLRSRVLDALGVGLLRLVEPLGKGVRGAACDRIGVMNDGVVSVTHHLDRHVPLRVFLGEPLEEGFGGPAVHVLLMAAAL